MRNTGKAVVLLAMALPAAAMSGDNTMVFSGKAIQMQLVQLASQAKTLGGSGSILGATGNLILKLSVRTVSGGAEAHAHYDDLMIVQQGSATLVTGGIVLDAKTTADGETNGTGIEGGTSQQIGVGDVLIVPAGKPHRLLIPPGTTYSALVAKIKE
jgi:mannose-6-phosphate isomerase-like protein (cupin superfamily)